MNAPTTDAPAIEGNFEIIPAGLELPAAEKQELTESFTPLLEKARELIKESESITSPKLARVSRLQFVKLRGDSERMRKSRKEHHLLMSKAIDGAHAILVAAVKGHEQRMDDIEKAEERRIQAEVDARGAERFTQLNSLGVTVYLPSQLGTMAQSDFDTVLADSKALHDARMKREQEERDAQAKKELEEAQERERIRAENERLKREAEEREKREAEEKRKREEEEAERLRLKKIDDDRIAKEKKDLEDKLEAERAEAKRKQDEADAAARKQKQEADALLAEETRKREAAEAAQQKQREELEANQRRATEAENNRRAEEQRRQQEADAAAEAALLAPDKTKLITIATAIRRTVLPPVKSKKAAAALAKFKTKIENLADWIEEQAEGL